MPVLVLLLLLVSPPFAGNTLDAYAEGPDYAIPAGHFYTQAGGSGGELGAGFAIFDGGTDSAGHTIRLWSEFQRLGGVGILGYPASRRFVWDGFICQVTQRFVLQWRPDSDSVAFLNIMDLISAAGKDDYLLNARQTPLPANFAVEEQGLSFQQIVAKRFALLDANPAIKTRFFQASDPLAMNGLPAASITDMGNVYVLRAQRVIIQQWKIDMPWAKAGEVTVALGGDIAKEVGLVAAQDAQATIPEPGPAQQSGSGIYGEAVLGPTCPVQIAGRSCQLPIQATISVQAADSGHELVRFTTAADGSFRISLPPGSYLLNGQKAQNTGRYPSAKPVQVTVPANQYAHVVIFFDTGIR